MNTAKVLRADNLENVQHASGRLGCPYCEAYGVSRLYLATVRLDSCECLECGARWDEEPITGQFRGRGTRQRVIDGTTRQQ